MAGRSDSTTKTIVLVHGGFVDGSGWEAVYNILKKAGYTVCIAQNPTISLADDVAAALADIAVEQPLNGTIELAGPEPIRMDELGRRFLSANRDARRVSTDVHAGYFGTAVSDQSLPPGNNPRLGPTRFDDWLRRSIPQG